MRGGACPLRGEDPHRQSRAHIPHGASNCNTHYCCRNYRGPLAPDLPQRSDQPFRQWISTRPHAHLVVTPPKQEREGLPCTTCPVRFAFSAETTTTQSPLNLFPLTRFSDRPPSYIVSESRLPVTVLRLTFERAFSEGGTAEANSEDRGLASRLPHGRGPRGAVGGLCRHAPELHFFL